MSDPSQPHMLVYVVVLTIKVGGPDKGDMDTQISVVRRAIQTQIYAKRYRRPCWVLGAAIEADLVGLFPLQLLEDALRFGFGRERHIGSISDSCR